MAGFDTDVVSKAFKEKKWYKYEDGEKIANGYSLRGRLSFKKAVEGLLDNLKKGVSKDIAGTNFRVLDARKNGIALDIEIEMIDNGDKGIAMLKIYGPYSKKEKKDNVVMVTKSKQSDIKFVTILAERIVKPLIAGYCSKKTSHESSKKDDLLRCPFCDKTSTSSPGMKGHITKMHKVQKFDKHSDNKDISKVILNDNKEVFDVIENLLNDVIVISDDEGSEKESSFTLDEKGECFDRKDEKEYCNVCEECDYKIIANRKYAAVQLLLKHKDECHEKTCSECEYKAGTCKT